MIAAYVASEKTLAAQIQQSEEAMKKALEDKAAAETKMNSLQDLSKISQAKINEMKAQVDQQKKSMAALVVSRDEVAKKIAAITVSQNEASISSEKAKAGIVDSVSKQDSIASKLAEKTATQAKQEMALLAKIQ